MRTLLVFALAASAGAPVPAQDAHGAMASLLTSPDRRIASVILSRAEETAAAAGFRDVVARAVKAGRADVCQRALDVAAVVSHLAPFVLETLFASGEREAGFVALVTACAAPLERVVLGHGELLGRAGLAGATGPHALARASATGSCVGVDWLACSIAKPGSC